MYWLELGGEDDAFAAREAENAAPVVEVVAPGLAQAGSVDTDRVRHLAYTHRANEAVGRTDASVESARALLEAASLNREGTVAVRARDVRGETGVSTGDAERELGGVLVSRGYEVDLDDPDNELRACFSDDVCLLGWLVAESLRDFGDRKPTERPFFQPGSMAPLDARAFVNMVGAGPEATILDPMCGTGGVLIEAGLVDADVVGVDAQRKMTRGARENLGAYLDGSFDVIRGDATRLPLRDDCADGVVFDAPYGRQSKIEKHSLDELVPRALAEAARVAPRAVMVADRSLGSVASENGWEVERVFQRRVHRSLTRFVHLLGRD